LDTIKSFLSATKEISQLPQKVQDSVQAFTSSGDDEKAQESLRACWRAFVEMEGDEVKDAVKAYTRRVGNEGVQAFDGVSIVKEDKENLVDALKVLDEFNGGDGSILASM
jgi:hypothetical protein